MKRLVFFFTLTLVSLATYATGYDSDIIYIDGTKWELLGRPVYADSTLIRELKAALPKDRIIMSSNWDGFTTYWSIQQEKLCLDSIQYELYDKATKKSWTECIPQDALLRVFRKYAEGNRIVATWLTNSIRLAKGKQIWYQHSYFERNYENEQIISIAQGKVTGRQAYQNYVKDGFSFHRFTPKNNAELREKFPLHIEQYPELANAKRIMFRIKQARVDAQGNLTECEVVVVPNDHPRLAAEMAKAMKAYHPWRVYYINGEYRAYGIEGYTFPYKLDD